MVDRSARVTNSLNLFRAGLVAAAAAGLIAGLSLTAQAQTAAPAAPAAAPKPAAPKPAAAAPKPTAPAVAQPEDPTPWVKFCAKNEEKKQVCLTAKELRSDQGQLVASVAVRDTEGEPKKTLLVAVPPLVLIQPGLRINVDKGKPEEAKYTICFPNACYSELQIGDQMAADIKKGQALVVTTLNVQGKPQGYPFLLSSFKTASEGPGIDPGAQQQSQDALQLQLQKRAEEAAKKLGAEAPKP